MIARPVSCSPFYAAVCGLLFGEGSAGDGAVECDTHDQQEPLKALRPLDMALHQAEAAGLEVREHVFDPPAHAVTKDGVAVGVDIHGDDPWLLVALFVPCPDVGFDAAAMESGTDDTLRDAGHDIAGGQLAALMRQRQVALEADAARPSRILAPTRSGARSHKTDQPPTGPTPPQAARS